MSDVVQNYIKNKNKIKLKAVLTAILSILVFFIFLKEFFHISLSDTIWMIFLFLILAFIGCLAFSMTYTSNMIKYFNRLVEDKIIQERNAKEYNEILSYAYKNRKFYDYAPINFYLIGLMQSFDKEIIKEVAEKEQRHLKSNDFRMNITFHLMTPNEKKEAAENYYNHLILLDKSEDDKKFHQIQKDFFSQNYEEVLNEIDDYPIKNTYDEVYKNYYKGLTLYSLNRQQEAKPYFENVIQNGNTLGIVKIVKDLMNSL